MDSFKTFTYWYMVVNLIGSAVFTAIALVLGGKDLMSFLRDLKSGGVDETDDGRVRTR